MKRALGVAVLVGLAACSASSSTPSASGPSGSSGSSGSGTFAGTIGKAPFAMKSGFAFKNADGTVDLVLSSLDGACDSAKGAKVHAGETLVQLFALTGTAPGAFTSANKDVKYATVAATCASGTPVSAGGAVSASGRATTSTVTISSLTASGAQGTLDLVFDDGSKASGSFDVPTCTATTFENAVCF